MRVLLDWCLKIGSLSFWCAENPLHLGEEGPQAQKIMEQAKKIADQTGLPVELTDERLSSSEAKRILRAQGLSEKTMRGKVDMVAASLFLQAWLDRSATEGE